ncbi:hypothetical protein BN946_scf184813.g4 [Trametes cinnabarina]|uniref:Uncharacterized protein n=1 Tax=Pycnoporus cinnabarinus TaxID=5643 RepID=A0A060SWY3_PYCCI|nr:hypothetical protein BN946_scf184813.g4 [Trametes cinnabarina]
MIIDKPPLPGDEVVLALDDAPPSYDALDNLPPPLPRDEKAGPSTNQPSQSSQGDHRRQQQASSPTAPPKSPSVQYAVGKRPASASGSSWFNFGPSARAAKEVRNTIRGLLRDLVKQTDSQGAIGVLESCADACRTYDISLSSLLQERSIEGHTPIYWAIINRPAQPPRPDEPDIVTALLSHSAPLSDETRLRRSPAFAPLSGSDEIILGGNVPVDDVDVDDVEGDETAFIANFRIPMFQKRMRISQEINLEFIAKGRLWSLKFLVAKFSDPRLGHANIRTGSWVAALHLLPHSPPTYIDSRLVIDDPRARTHPLPSPHPQSGPPASLKEAVEGMMQQAEAESTMSPVSTSPRDKPKPRIELRMKRSEQLTAPASMRTTYYPVVVVSLEEDVRAKNLQFKGCPYIESDGSLVARLEARLVQSESECTIC